MVISCFAEKTTASRLSMLVFFVYFRQSTEQFVENGLVNGLF